MKRLTITGIATLAALLAAPPLMAEDHEDDMAEAGTIEYRVEITNLTRDQVFTPVLAAAHEPSVQPFVAGRPAGVELEMLAEGGDTGPLASLLLGLPEVGGANVSDGPVPPGETATIFVESRGRADHISLLAMLVPTNDGFVALNTVPAPRGRHRLILPAVAYDAGTEANDEACASIPGPPQVCGGEGFNADRDDASPFIHVHSGIHGVGDLAGSMYDWNNPVARVVITRVPNVPLSRDSVDEWRGRAPRR